MSRNNLVKKINVHKRKIAQKKVSEFDSICSKHNVGPLSFKSCRLVDVNGAITLIDPDSIFGNMKCGVMVVRTKSILPSDEIYDLTILEKNKIERDEKKRLEEADKFNKEIERVKDIEVRNQNTLNSPIESPQNLTEFLQNLTESSTKSHRIS